MSDVRIVLALDVPTAARARDLLDRLGGGVDFVKVGLELFVAEGPDLVRMLRGRGLDVFLDLKLHDIPNTVARATARAAELDVQLLTVHAAGGARMMEAARRARDDTGSDMAILGVTVLTSHDPAGLGEAWGREGVRLEDEVRRLARQAVTDVGLDGVVCAPSEAASLRSLLGPDALLVTPGIRRPGDGAQDQRRVAGPEDAARAGASHLVVGRTVTAAPDPSAALDEIRRSVRGVGAAGRG